MTTVTAWRTDEPCPVCATGLIVLDDGTSPPGLSAVCAAGRHLDQRRSRRR